MLRALDQRYRLAENAARCLHEPRDSHKVQHDLLTLVRQRLFAIAQGYEDNNDATTLSKDPPFKIMAGKASQHQETGEKQRLFTSFSYQAESWDQPRRIIAKMEYTHLGTNRRFVVTNLVRNIQFVYNDISCSGATWQTASRN